MIEFGRYEMDTWYYSPYPEPYASCSKLYVCEYSLKYFRKKKTLLRHLAKLDIRHPPGGVWGGAVVKTGKACARWRAGLP
jgi:histone acetyltransferase MYST1